MGLPIVSTPVGGIPDYVNDQFAYSSNDVEELGEHILYLAKNQEYQRMRGKLARAHAVANFDWANIASQVLHYTKIVTKYNTPIYILAKCRSVNDKYPLSEIYFHLRYSIAGY